MLSEAKSKIPHFIAAAAIGLCLFATSGCGGTQINVASSADTSIPPTATTDPSALYHMDKNSPARDIGGKTASSAAESTQWAGDTWTGIIQIPSDWNPVATSSSQYTLRYESPSHDSLEIVVDYGSYRDEADKLGASATDVTELTIAGHNAIRVTGQEGSSHKVTYLIERPEVEEHRDGCARFVFLFAGDVPAWVEKSMASMVKEADSGQEVLLPESGTGELAGSETQWAGFEEAGYVQLPSSWARQPALGSGGSDTYAVESSEKGSKSATPLGSIIIDKKSVDARNLITGAGRYFTNPANCYVDHVRVNGLDSRLLVCTFDSEGVAMDGCLCYIDDSDGFATGTVIILKVLKDSDVPFEDILSTYVAAKP